MIPMSGGRVAFLVLLYLPSKLGLWSLSIFGFSLSRGHLIYFLKRYMEILPTMKVVIYPLVI